MQLPVHSFMTAAIPIPFKRPAATFRIPNQNEAALFFHPHTRFPRRYSGYDTLIHTWDLWTHGIQENDRFGWHYSVSWFRGPVAISAPPWDIHAAVSGFAEGDGDGGNPATRTPWRARWALNASVDGADAPGAEIYQASDDHRTAHYKARTL